MFQPSRTPHLSNCSPRLRCRRGGLCLLALVLLAGCASRRNSEILEARLRQQEDRLADLQSQLAETRSELRVVRREADSLRSQLVDHRTPALPPEQADSVFRLEGIELSKLMTGGVDRDGREGDELLSAVILPRDEQGSVVKAPGRVELELLDLTRPGGARRVGHWKFGEEETGRQWHRGFINSGYQFELSWQHAPTSNRLLLVARFTTPDDRRFETNREVSIVPPAANSRSLLSERPGDGPRESGPALRK